MHRHFSIILLALFATALSGCGKYSEQNATRVCGVPVKGTPWELAATVADHGEGGFVPECVEIYGTKAYIKGWIDTNGCQFPWGAFHGHTTDARRVLLAILPTCTKRGSDGHYQ